MTKEEAHSFAASEGEIRNCLEWERISEEGLLPLESSSDPTVAARARKTLNALLTARTALGIALKHARGE